MSDSHMYFLAKSFQERHWEHKQIDVYGDTEDMGKLTNEQLRSLVENQLGSDPDTGQLHIVEIKDDGKIVLEGNIVVNLNQLPNQVKLDWEVKHVKSRDKTIQVTVRRRSWKELWHRMTKRWGVDAPIMAFIVKYLLLPIAVTGKFLFARKSVNARASEELNKMLSAVHPRNPKEVRRLLRQQIRLLEGVQPHANNEIESLQKALDLAKKVSTAKNKGTLGNLTQELAEQIKSMEKGEEITFPAGFYDDDGVFQPTLYTFRKKEGKGLMLYRFELGAEGESNRWEFKDISAKTLKPMITRFLTEGSEPSYLEPKDAEQQQVYRQALSHLNRATQVNEIKRILEPFLNNLTPEMRDKIAEQYKSTKIELEENPKFQKLIKLVEKFPKSKKKKSKLINGLAQIIAKKNADVYLPGGYIDDNGTTHAYVFKIIPQNNEDKFNISITLVNKDMTIMDDLKEQPSLKAEPVFRDELDFLGQNILRKADKNEELREFMMSQNIEVMREAQQKLKLLEGEKPDPASSITKSKNEIIDFIEFARNENIDGFINSKIQAIKDLKNGGASTLTAVIKNIDGTLELLKYEYKMTENGLTLSRYEIDLESGEKIKEVQLPSKEPEKGKTAFIQQQVLLQKLWKTMSVEKAPETDILADKSEEQLEKISARERIVNQIIKHGGEGESISRHAKDGFELIHAWMTKDQENDESSLSDRIQFVVHLIEAQLQLVTQASEKLPLETRHQVANELLYRLQSLRNRVSHLFQDEEAFHELFGSEDSLFGNLEARIRGISGALPIEIGEKPQLLTSKTREAIRSDQIGSGVDEIQKDILESAATNLHKLENALTDKNYQQATTLYTLLVDQIDTQVEKGNYQDALELAAVLQEKLPIPETKNDKTFWGTLIHEEDAWESATEWGAQLERLTRCQWEASTRLHRKNLEPREMIGLMQGRAILVKLERMKIQWVINNAYKKNLKIPSMIKNMREGSGYPSNQFTDEWKKTFTLEQTASLVFQHYQTDTVQFEDILKYHPYYRLSVYPHLAERAKGILQYLNGAGATGGKRYEDVPIIRLDAYVDAPITKEEVQYDWDPETRSKVYSRDSDYIYLKDLQTLAKEYGKDVDFKTIWKEVSLDNKGVKPFGMRCLQRHAMMFQMLYRPEFSLALQFGKNQVTSAARALAWWNKLEKQALIDTEGDPELVPIRKQELAYQDLNNKIDSSEMKGRLKITSGNYMSGSRALMVKSSKGSGSLYYLPWGLGLATAMKESFNPGPNDQTASDLGGSQPTTWNSIIGQHDGNAIRPGIAPKDLLDKTLRYPQSETLQKRSVDTEATLMKKCLLSENDLSPVDEYLMRTLTVTQGKDDRLMAGASTLLEGLQLILARPDLLEHPTIRHKLDLVFTGDGIVNHLYKYSPHTLKELGIQLKTGIEKQMTEKNILQAAYLMHVGELIAMHADLKELPRYTSKYNKNNPISGIDFLIKHRVNAPQIVSLAELEASMLNWEQNKDEISDATRANILLAAQNIKSYGESVGSPLMNHILLNWVRENFLPHLVSRELDPVLESLIPPKERSKEKWIRDEKISAYLYKKGDLQIDLRSLRIQKGKSILPGKPIKAKLPEDLRLRVPEISELLPRDAIIDKSTGMKMGSHQYTFNKNKTEYRILHDTRSGEACLSRKHKDQWYRLVKPDLPSDSEFSVLTNQGIWIEESACNNGLIFFDNAPQGYRELSFDLDENGQLINIQSGNDPINLSAVPEHLPFVHPTHAICHVDQDNLWILADKGMVIDQGIITENGHELGQIIAADEDAPNLTPGDRRARLLSKLLGSDLSVQAYKKEGVTSMNTLLIWPHAIQSLPGRALKVTPESSLKVAATQPLARVKIDSEGRLSTSAAGYLYMAYVLIKRKEFKMAKYMLEKAGRSRLDTDEDRQLFSRVSDLFRSENPRTGRSVALQLQAELLLLDIERQQIGKFGFDPQELDEHAIQVKRMHKFLEIYNLRLSAPGTRITKDLQLTDDQKNQINSIRREGFLLLLQSHDGVKSSHKHLHVRKESLLTVAPEDVPNRFWSTIATFAIVEKKRLSSTDKLLEPGGLTSRFLLENFAVYYNKIINGEITRENMDINVFFRRLEHEKDPNLNSEERGLSEMADIARRILAQTFLEIGFLAPQVKHVNNRIDFEKLTKLRKEVPKEVLAEGALMTALRILGRKLRRLDRSQKELLFPREAQEVMAELKGPVMQTLKTEKAAFSYRSYDLITPGGLKASERQAFVAPIPEGHLDVERLLKDKFYKRLGKQIGLSEIEIITLGAFLKEAQKDKKQSVSLDELKAALQAGTGISSEETRIEQETRQQVIQLEKNLVRTIDEKHETNYDSNSMEEDLLSFSSIFPTDAFFNPIDKDHQTKLTKGIPDNLKNAIPKDIEGKDARNEENNQLRNGIDDVVENRIKRQVKFERELKQDAKSSLSGLIENQLDPDNDKGAFAKRKTLNADLLAWAKQCPIEKVRAMIRDPLRYPDQVIIDAILDAYQRGDSRVSDKEKEITAYLIWETAVQQLEAAQKSLVTLDGNLNPYDKKEQERTLCEIIDRHLKPERYLKDGVLKSPKLYRKFLISEHRLGIILRKGQRDKVEQFNNDPNAWASLRMGEGKTFFIMPCIAELLAEQGMLPVMLVPPQLQSLNQAEFDEKTLKIFGRRAEPFRIDLDKNDSAAYLAGQYHHLLKVRKKGGYIVTSIQTLASARSLPIQLREERRALRVEIQEKTALSGENIKTYFEKDEDGVKLGLKMIEISKRLFWARKIERLFDGKLQTIDDNKEEKETILRTQLFADEADTLFHITKEINRAIGDAGPVDKQARQLCSRIFNTILVSPELSELKEAILSGTQVTLNLDKFLPIIAEALLESKEVSALIPEKVDAMEMIDYLIGKRDNLPENLGEWNDSEKKRKIATLHHLLSQTLSSVLGTEAGLRFKLDDARGCLAVPTELGEETVGNRFGDEYELIAFQFMAHIQAFSTQAESGSTQEFYTEGLKSIQATDQNLFNEIKDATASSSIKEMVDELLINKELWKLRLKVMDLRLFDQGIVSRYREQIAVPAQAVQSGRNAGGVTGTLNPYSLPGFKERGKESTRTVEVETYIKVVAKHEKGVNALVKTLNDLKGTDENFKAMLNNPETVGIVNEGGYGLSGLSVSDWVDHLRTLQTEEPKKDLVFLEKNRSGVTRILLWEAGKDLPVETSKNALKKRNKEGKKFIGIYAPQFTRGADLPLGAGKVHFLPSRTSNPQNAGQSIWRGRGTGERHTSEVWMPESVQGKKKWTYANFIDWLTERGMEEQLPLNLMAQRFRITEIATTGLRSFQNSFTKEQLQTDYWSKENAVESYALESFEDSLSEVLRSYFIKDKTINFEADYQPSRKVDTLKNLEDTYDSEVNQVETKVKLLPKKAAETAWSLIEEVGSEEEILSESNKLDKPTEPMLNTLLGKDFDQKTIQSILESQEENDRSILLNKALLERLLQQVFDIYEEDPTMNFEDALKQGHSRWRENIYDAAVEGTKNPIMKMVMIKKKQDFLENFDDPNYEDSLPKLLQGKNREQVISLIHMCRMLKNAESIWSEEEPHNIVAGFHRLADAHICMKGIIGTIKKAKDVFVTQNKIHSCYVDKTTTASAGTSGMQEQVQQQQQQMMAIRQTKNKNKKPKDLKPREFHLWKPGYMETPNTEDEMNPFKPLCNDWGALGIFVSEEAQALINEMPSLHGEPIWRFAVNDNGQIMILSKQDYYSVAKGAQVQVGLYAPTGDEYVRYQCNSNPIDKPSDNTLRNLALAKIRLGFTHFSKGEKELLFKWKNKLKGAQLKSFNEWARNTGSNIKFN